MPVFHDTKLYRYITDPRYKNSGFEEFCAYAYDHELSDISEIAALERAYFAEKIYAWEDELPSGLKYILTLEEELAWVLAKMESIGAYVDKKELGNLTEEIKEESRKLETEMRELVGEPFNPLSAKQVQYILFEKLGLKSTKKIKTGFSVDAETLEELGKTCDLANLILRYRAIEKLRGTYSEGLAKEISTIDGRIHTTYNQAATATGRLSSESPNLQNIPSGEGYADRIKAAFKPEKEGYSYLVADYSQVELRILAILSKDEHLLDAFEKGEDIHERTARFLFPTSEKISKEERRIAKSVNFWVIYGITGFGLSKTLGTNPSQASAYIDAFYIKYPGTKAYYSDLLDHARESGYVETLFGRRRYIPGLSDGNKTLRAAAEREAMNAPIQGTAADVIKIAMMKISKRLEEEKLKSMLIMQVHDELVFEMLDSEKDALETIVREEMEGVLEDPRVKLTCDIGSGKNWLEAK